MMNAMPRTPSARPSFGRSGQSVYEVLLIIACAAMALAVILAVHEYVSLYQGESAMRPSAAPTSAPPMPAAKAPAPTAMPKSAPAAAPKAAPGATAAPAATP
jgi:hypothetical protein